MELKKLVELYELRREQREAKLKEFYAGTRKYIIIQRPTYNLWGECNSVEGILENNMKHLESWLSMEWTDELPHLQPWVGTGVYANAFGCEYLWRDGQAPDTRYKYYSIEDVKDIDCPDWRESHIMGMVLDAIDALLDRTRGAFPIALTDTQSPCDTATLVLETTEFFTGLYTHPAVVADFMNTIADLVVEFSTVQGKRIGEERVSRPGHVMPSLPGFRGITISDDNLAVSSPTLNEQFSLPADKKIGDAFGGTAIHSCGVWDHTMKKLSPEEGFMAVDLAVDGFWDPNPNAPKAVRSAIQETGVIVKARVNPDSSVFLQQLDELVGKDMRLILDIPVVGEGGEAYPTEVSKQSMLKAEGNYKIASEKCESLFS